MSNPKLVLFSQFVTSNPILNGTMRPPVLQLPPIQTLAELDAEDLPELVELVRGLIHLGTKSAIAGGSKSKKTFMATSLGISVAVGREWLGLPTTQGKVLYLNFELHAASFRRRIRDICRAMEVPLPPDFDVWNLRGHACSAEIIIPRIIERIMGKGYALVIIDPIYKLLGGRDENSASGMGGLLNEFEKIAVQTGAAVLFCAHYSKGNQAGKEAMDRMSGSGVFARDPDTILPVTLHTESNAFVVEPILRNFPPVDPFVIRWEHPLMSRADDLDPTELKGMRNGRTKHVPNLEEFMLIFPLAGNGKLDDGTLTTAEISKQFKDRGWSQAAIKDLKDEAIQKGNLRYLRRPHNKQFFGRPEVIAAIEHQEHFSG